MKEKIIQECLDISEMLCKKNEKYGNSALEPLRIFSTVDRFEQLRVRIDDKLNRVKNCTRQEDEDDSVLDLVGYLILYRIALKS